MLGRLYTEQYPSFGDFDREALRRLIRRAQRPACQMAEIGSWLGAGSTRVFIEELAAIKGAVLHCIDTWRGSPGVVAHQAIARDFDVLATFRANVEAAGGVGLVRAMQLPSVDAARLFVDASLDLVFIDADHRYGSTAADIAAWPPKIRPGGILCGHDCEMRPGDARAALTHYRDCDAVAWPTSAIPTVHPGVILAVAEAFGDDVTLFSEEPITLEDGREGRSSLWYRWQAAN